MINYFSKSLTLPIPPDFGRPYAHPDHYVERDLEKVKENL
jgi:hypothetical protein